MVGIGVGEVVIYRSMKKKFCKKCRKLITGYDIYCGPCGLELINQLKNMADEKEIKEEEVTEEGDEETEEVMPEFPDAVIV